MIKTTFLPSKALQRKWVRASVPPFLSKFYDPVTEVNYFNIEEYPTKTDFGDYMFNHVFDDDSSFAQTINSNGLTFTTVVPYPREFLNIPEPSRIKVTYTNSFPYPRIY